jgi:hypothetical protein
VTVDVRIEASTPSLYSNIQSVANGLCLDVNGKNTASGAFVDTWQCVPDYNEVRSIICISLSGHYSLI